MAPPNARDEQVIREALLQSNPHARDEEIIRETLAQFSPNARGLQMFRETLLIRTAGSVAQRQPNICVIC